MSTITINGTTITTSGKNVTITNGKIFINGEDVTPDSKEINISIDGYVESIKADACNSVTVTGNSGSIHTQSGDVNVSGNVDGSIQTMSGDVDCYNVGGSVSTMSGDIKHRKS